MSNPSPPSPPPQPAAPDYAQANATAINQDIETLPVRKQIEAASKLGQRVTVTIPEVRNQDGKVVTPAHDETYDFSGSGDLQQESATADSQAQDSLNIQNKYGPQFIQNARDQLQAADPEGFAARKQLFDKVTADLNSGYELTPDQERQTEQDIRGAQAARGNYLGSAPVSAESTVMADTRQKMYQQRLANVGSALAGTTPTAQFQSISGAQNGAAPYQPNLMAPGVGLNPNAGALGTQFALGEYNTQAGMYNAQLGYQANLYNTTSNQPNYWMQGAGMAVSALSSIASIAH